MKISHLCAVLAFAFSSIAAEAQTAPTITSVASTTVDSTNPTTFTITATGTAPITFSATNSGSFPGWLALSSAGVVTATPPNGSPLTIGTQFTINVVATGSGTPATQSLVITVGTVLNSSSEGVIMFPLTAGAINYLSLPLENDPIYSDVVQTVTSNQITVANTSAFLVSGTQTLEQLTEAAGSAVPYFVKFLSGNEQGRILLVTASTASSLTLDITDHTSASTSTALVNQPATTFDVAAGDSFEVFAGDTLATLFGGTQATLQYVNGAASLGQADAVGIQADSKQPTSSYYFNTTVGHWVLYQVPPSTANANDTPVYPHSCLAITRRIAYGNGTFPVVGAVTQVPLLIKTLSYATYGTVFTSIQYPAPVVLSQLNFGSSWLKGTGTGNSDVLNVFNSSTERFDSYYQLASDSTWRKYTVPPNNTDVSSFAIPAGSAVSIAKRQVGTGGASYLKPQLPY